MAPKTHSCIYTTTPRGSEVVILAACCFLAPFSPLSPASVCLGGISPVTTQAVWQLCLRLGLPESLGDPAGVQQAWCFWKGLDLPCARRSGRANVCLEFPDLLLLLKGLWRGSPAVPATPITKLWGTLAWFIWRGFTAHRVQLQSISLGPGRLNGPGCHRPETCVKVRKGK